MTHLVLVDPIGISNGWVWAWEHLNLGPSWTTFILSFSHIYKMWLINKQMRVINYYLNNILYVIKLHISLYTIFSIFSTPPPLPLGWLSPGGNYSNYVPSWVIVFITYVIFNFVYSMLTKKKKELCTLFCWPNNI